MVKRARVRAGAPLYAGDYTPAGQRSKKGKGGRPLPLSVQAKLARAELAESPNKASGMCENCHFVYPLHFLRRLDRSWKKQERLICLLCIQGEEKADRDFIVPTETKCR